MCQFIFLCLSDLFFFYRYRNGVEYYVVAVSFGIATQSPTSQHNTMDEQRRRIQTDQRRRSSKVVGSAQEQDKYEL